MPMLNILAKEGFKDEVYFRMGQSWLSSSGLFSSQASSVSIFCIPQILYLLFTLEAGYNVTFEELHSD